MNIFKFIGRKLRMIKLKRKLLRMAEHRYHYNKGKKQNQRKSSKIKGSASLIFD